MSVIDHGVFAGYKYQVIQNSTNTFTITINNSTIGIASSLSRAFSMVDDYFRVKKI
jgi:hypothetical protein